MVSDTECLMDDVGNLFGLILGGSHLAGRILPYAVEVHEQLCTKTGADGGGRYCLSGLEWYDDWMFVHAVLMLLMAMSVRKHDILWLTDWKLMEDVKWLEDEAEELEDEWGWRDRCMKVMVGMAAYIPKRGVRGICRMVSLGLDGEVDPLVASTVVDGGRLEGSRLLGEIFYVVTGQKLGTERSAVMDDMAVGEGQVFRWAPECVVREREGGKECVLGRCRHRKGLLPVIGQRQDGGEVEGLS